MRRISCYPGRQGRQPNRCCRTQARIRSRWSLIFVKNSTIFAVSSTVVILGLIVLLLHVAQPAVVVAQDRVDPGVASEGPRPTGLMCELLAEPSRTEIFDPQPEFTWVVPLACRGDRQTAYQILVATSREQLVGNAADAWDSGKVESSESVAVEYQGKPLASQQTYYWKVRTWNRDGRPSGWSDPQCFRTGTLRDTVKPTDSRIPRYTTPRYPLVQTEVAPVRLVKKGPGHWFVDFGRAAYGTIQLTASAESDGRRVTLHLGEHPGPNDMVDRKPGGTIRYRATNVALRQGTHTYRATIPPDKRNTGAAAIKIPAEVGEVLPFRYCEVVDYPGELQPSAIRQICVHYPFDDNASEFHSSSKVLNDVWQLCKYSMKATSFCGVYVDGDRERIPYEADAYINQLGHYCTDREFTLARYSHEYLILHPTWPTEWPLHSVLMAWADYLHTGDQESAEEFYEDLKAKTLIALARDDGLISTRTGLVTPEVLRSIYERRLEDIVDWPLGERDGYVFRPINTVVNAMHFRTLVIMAELAEALQHGDEARDFRKRAALVARSVNEKLFDRKTGVYVDGEGASHSALHANMFPLAMGVVPHERQAVIGKFLASKGMACSVYGAQYLLESLYEAAADEHAFHLMTDTDTDRSWPHMVYDVGTTITLEAWDNKYKPNQDWNHAWGAAPANIIPRKLMGVEPLEPGFGKIRICPQPGSLTEASLRLPTIRGPVLVDYHKSNEGRYELCVAIPANATAEVSLPAANPDRVTEGGQPVGAVSQVVFKQMDGARAVFSAESGTYRFAWPEGTR